MFHSKKTFQFSLAAVFFLSAILYFSFTPVKNLLIYFLDDSFFYLKTAWNISLGYGSTFDRVNLTNGYHPLWMLMLSVYFAAAKISFIENSPENFLRMVCCLHLLIYIFTVYFLKKILDIINPGNKNFQITVIFAILSLLLIYLRDFGFESHLACLVITIYLYISSREIFSCENYLMIKSLLLVLLFLTRFDYIFQIIPLILLYEILFCENGKKRYTLTVLLTPVFTSSVIYFLINLFYFGNLLTNSAYLKNSFPEVLLIDNIKVLGASKSFNQITKLSFILICNILFVLKLKNEKYEKNILKFDMLLLFLNAGGFLFCVMHLAFNKGGLPVWYATFPAYLALLVFVRLIQSREKYFKLILPSLIILLVFYFLYYRLNQSETRLTFAYDYAKELKKNTEAGDRIFQFDISGVAGFFSERNIINGDGLANSFEYIKNFESGKLSDYFKDEKINFYSTHAESNFDVAVKEINSVEKYSDTVNTKYSGFEFTFPKENLVLEFVNPRGLVKKNLITKWYLFRF